MSFTRRIHKEMDELQKQSPPHFSGLQVDPTNMLVWQGLVVPKNPPYNRGAFRLQLTFPEEYPFKAPTLVFRTKIYHPNIDEDGKVCLAMLTPDNWKPTTRVSQVIEEVVNLVNSPQPENPLRADLADELRSQRKKFMKNAEQFTIKHAERRP